MKRILVQEAAFDLGGEIDRLRQGRVGAIVSFTGTVRDRNDGRDVAAMTLEHYPGMTEQALDAIANQAHARWPLTGLTIIHRFGRLEVGEDIVLVLTASAHRDAAFDAARFLMDWLKTDAPFWKKEETPEGARWVDARESDDAARARWESAQ